VIEQTREDERLHGVTRVDGFSQRRTSKLHGGGGTIEGSSGAYLPAFPWCLSLWAEKKTRGRRKEAAIEQARQLPCASAPVCACVCLRNRPTGWLAELLCFAATPMQRSESGGDGACLFI
jgi:hypothetical protein